MRLVLVMRIIATSSLILMVFTADSSAQSETNDSLIGKIEYKSNKVFLAKDDQLLLKNLIPLIKSRPDYMVAIESNGWRLCEFCAQRSWDRAFSIIKFLRTNGIPQKRLVMSFGDDYNTRLASVSLVKDWEGPQKIPPPIPCYSYHKLTRKRCPVEEGHEIPKD